jgi:hypothetical protein
LTLFPLCFFRFSSILLASSVIKKRILFSNWIFCRDFWFWTDLLQKWGSSNFFKGSFRRQFSALSI